MTTAQHNDQLWSRGRPGELHESNPPFLTQEAGATSPSITTDERQPIHHGLWEIESSFVDSNMATKQCTSIHHSLRCILWSHSNYPNSTFVPTLPPLISMESSCHIANSDLAQVVSPLSFLRHKVHWQQQLSGLLNLVVGVKQTLLQVSKQTI